MTMTLYRLIVTALLAMGLVQAFGQTFVGTVSDESGQPLNGVSVILLDGQRKSVSFGRSGQDGHFKVQGKAGREAGYLVFSCVGYERDTIAAAQFTNGQTVVMASKAVEIREVTVKADRITVHGDTLNYLVDAFKQKQDRSIADVISKMPGLEVKADGTIEFEGKAINKFYVEGMDLMGSKYAQTSENLDASKVKSVQVLQNHQPIKALKDVSFSEQAALNLVLTDEAKNVWQGLIDVGAGHTLQGAGQVLGDNRLMAMMFGRKMQSVSMFKQNNTGKDIAREVGDVGALLDYAPTPGGVLSNITLPAPGLKAQRSKFNQSHILATNWLFKTRGDHDLRLQFNGGLDMSRERQYSETQYTDIMSGMTVVEEARARSHANHIDGEIQYKANTAGLYLTNTLKGYLNMDYSHGRSTLDGTPTLQDVKPRRRYASDQFRLIKNLGGGKSVQAGGYASLTHQPGRLLLMGESWQRLTLTSLLYGGSTSWGHAVGKSSMTYTLSHDGQSERYRLDNYLERGRDTYRQNRTRLQLAWALNHAVWRVNASLPLSLMSRALGPAHKTSWLIEPQLFVICEPSSRWQMMMIYNYSWNPLDVSQSSALPVFSDYTNLQRGAGRLDDTRAHVVMTGAQYKNTVQGMFAKLGFTLSGLQRLPLYESSLEQGVYCRQATGSHTGAQTYTVDGRVSRRLDWASLNATLSGSYSWNNHNLLQGEQLVAMQLRSSAMALHLAAQPLTWFSTQLTSSWSYSRQVTRHNHQGGDGLHSFSHSARLFFMPGNWQVEWATELTHSSEKAVKTTTFSDLSVTYRTKRYETGLLLNNIMGNSEWHRRVITTAQTVYTVNTLRPREILAKLLLNI